MSTPGFSLDQLMELAGLSVANAVHDFYIKVVLSSTSSSSSSSSNAVCRRNVLILVGPGNNGGDGLVAARHLKHFGYDPYVVYPKKSAGQLFTNLVRQCEDLGITVSGDLDDATAAVTATPTATAETSAGGTSAESKKCPHFGAFDVVVDALFGFSFEGPPREPFASMIAFMAETSVPVISIDVPSGWHVEKGDVHTTRIR